MCPPGEALAWAKVSTSHSDVFPASINVSSCATHLDALDELINKTHQLARPRLWLSMMGLMVEVVLVASWSKSRQKSKNRHKVQKLQRSEKICKGHRFGGTFTEVPIFCQKTRTFDRTLIVFQALFTGPRSSLDTTFGLIINQAVLTS